jgi:hypothetical protein
MEEFLLAEYKNIMINKSMYFLQIFPQLFNDTSVAETFITSNSLNRTTSNNYELKHQNENIQEFKNRIFYNMNCV